MSEIISCLAVIIAILAWNRSADAGAAASQPVRHVLEIQHKHRPSLPPLPAAKPKATHAPRLSLPIINNQRRISR